MKICRMIFAVCGLLGVSSLSAQVSTDTKDVPVPIVCEVVTTEGRPAAGAKVYVNHITSRDRILEDPIIAQGTTDADGRFRSSFVPPAHWTYFSASIVVDAGKEGIGIGTLIHHPSYRSPGKHVIQLLPTAELKATILTPEGKPAAGLEVWVQTLSLPRKGDLPVPGIHATTSRLPDALWKARTDAQGRMVMPMIPEGASVCLKHGDKRWAQFKGRFDSVMRPLAKVDGAGATLQLIAAGSIRGRIILPNGRPAGGSTVSIIEGVTPYVTAYGAEMNATEKGEFIFDQIPPSTYRLHYDTKPPHFDRWIGTEREGIVVNAGKTTDVGDLVVAEAAYVTGEVLDAETGKAIEEPLVFRLGAGQHDLRYLALRGPREEYLPPSPQDTASVEVKGGERKTVVFKLRPVKPEDRILGVVVGEEGKPVANAQVVMQGHGGMHYPFTTVTDKSGEFMFIRQKGATQEAVLAHDSKAMSDIMLAVSGQTMTLRLREKGWGKVLGTVVDDAGKPVTGAEISWYLPESVAAWGPVLPKAKSDAEGRFEFPRFWSREKSITFFCKAEGLGSGSLRKQSVRDGDTTELKFVLKQANTFVAGVLVDSVGKPVQGTWVHASGEGQRSADVRTDAEGRFRIEGLARGQVHLSATLKTENYTSEASSWVRAGDAGVKLVFPVADGEVSGVVVDATGNPVPMAKVESFERGRKTTADKDGRFQLSGIVSGWFTAKAEAPNSLGERMEKELRLKSGMKDVKIVLPAKKRESHVRSLDPVDLTGKPAAEVKIATWVNCEPLPPHGRGKVRILDFWGIQCGPCIAAFPKVQKFWENHRDKDIEIVAVTGFYPEQEVKEFLAKNSTYNFPVALETDDSTAFHDYDVRGIPTYVVIDAFGKIVSKGHDFEEAGKVALGLVGEGSSR